METHSDRIRVIVYAVRRFLDPIASAVGSGRDLFGKMDVPYLPSPYPTFPFLPSLPSGVHLNPPRVSGDRLSSSQQVRFCGAF